MEIEAAYGADAQNSSNAGDTAKQLEEEATKSEAEIKSGVSKNKQEVSIGRSA